MERPPAPQPPCPSVTVLSLQPPSPICHPDRREGSAVLFTSNQSQLEAPPSPSRPGPVTFDISCSRLSNRLSCLFLPAPSAWSEAPRRSLVTKGLWREVEGPRRCYLGRCCTELSGHKHKKSRAVERSAVLTDFPGNTEPLKLRPSRQELFCPVRDRGCCDAFRMRFLQRS